MYRLRQLQRPLDVFLSHDWPQGIERHGNTAQLLRCKPFLRPQADFLFRPPCLGMGGPWCTINICTYFSLSERILGIYSMKRGNQIYSNSLHVTVTQSLYR